MKHGAKHFKNTKFQGESSPFEVVLCFIFNKRNYILSQLFTSRNEWIISKFTTVAISLLLNENDLTAKRSQNFNSNLTSFQSR